MNILDLLNTPVGDCMDAERYRHGDAEGSTGRDEHKRYVYRSPYRPFFFGFDPEQPYTLLAGTGRTFVIGTSDPLPLKVLDAYQLQPVDPFTRNHTAADAWDGSPIGAVSEDDTYTRALMQGIPSHGEPGHAGTSLMRWQRAEASGHEYFGADVREAFGHLMGLGFRAVDQRTLDIIHNYHLRNQTVTV